MYKSHTFGEHNISSVLESLSVSVASGQIGHLKIHCRGVDVSTLLTKEIKLLQSPSELKGGTAQTGRSRQSIYTILGDCKQKLLSCLGGKAFLLQSFGD